MRKWLPLLTVCLGTFLLLLDVTIVNVALPAMAVDLHTSFGSLQWVVDAYALALAALLLGTGALADRIGHRRAYLAGLVVFAGASLGCGLAPDAGWLIAARAVQAVGAAAMFATNFALLNASYTGRDRGTAYGIWGAVNGAASAIGPVLGGLLTEHASWRWIFFVNLPVSALAVGLCIAVLRPGPTSARRVDLLGTATFTAAAATLTYGLIQAGERGWSAPSAWGWLAAAPVLLAGFVLVEARVREPMLDLGLLRNRAFIGLLIGAGLLTYAAYGMFPVMSIWLQSVLGLRPVAAGAVAVPLSVAAFAVSAGIGRHLHKSRPDLIVGGGLLLIGAGGLLSAALVHGGAGWAALVPGLIVSGIGVGLATPTIGSATTSAVPLPRGGMASGAVNTMRQLGFAFGIATVGAVFAARAAQVLAQRGVPGSDRAARLLAGGHTQRLLGASPGPARSALADHVHAAAVSGLQSALVVCGVAGLLAGLTVLALVRPRRTVAADVLVQRVPVGARR